MIDRERIDLNEKEAVAKTIAFLTNATASEIKDFRRTAAEVHNDLVYLREHATAISHSIPHCFNSPGHILAPRRGLQIFWHECQYDDVYYVYATPLPHQEQKDDDIELVYYIADHRYDDFHSIKAFIDGPWRDPLHQLRLDLENAISE